MVELQHNVWARQAQLLRLDGRPQPLGSIWAKKNIVLVPCPYQLTYEGHPIEGIHINKKVAASLIRVLNAIWVECDRSQATIEKFGYHRFSGSFFVRPMRGGKSLSMHAFGRAVDFNAAANAFHSRKHSFKSSDIIVQCFKAESWVWGGDWAGRSVDAMHFQAARVR
jgi:hypothetical protein